MFVFVNLGVVNGGALMRGSRIEAARDIYFAGLANGDGAGLDVGHSRTKPSGDCVSGIRRKLSVDTALWILKKYSVISFDENMWYRSCRFVK